MEIRNVGVLGYGLMGSGITGGRKLRPGVPRW